ncbi:hypothetical protein V6N13_130169 [Hibiscus sabdariffa]
MTLYIGCEASKIWKRICAETSSEINLLLDNWKYILAGVIFQYVHGLAARGVHYLHRPGPTLQDLGFFILPDTNYKEPDDFPLPFFLFDQRLLRLSESSHSILLSFLVQIIIAERYTVFPLYFPQGAIYGCGDLIFSSHMIFTLVFVLTYQKYGTRRCIKQFGWLVAIIQSFLIVASRKHYTVDVVVACGILRRQEIARTNGSYPLLLPLSAKDKDNKTKEENHKLLNRNSLTLQIGGREVKAMARFWKTAMQTRWILQ